MKFSIVASVRPRFPTPAPDPTPAPSPAQLPAGAKGFLAPSLASSKTAEAENVADSFDKALDDVTRK